jgi:hypothetical protein
MMQLAVINTAGEVWARDLDLSSGNVGAGSKLTGPGLFGGPDDQFVVASGTSIAVITKSGAFWPRTVEIGNAISPGVQTSGSLFGGQNAKYVLYYSGSSSVVYVVNTKGEVWTHSIGTQSGNPTSVVSGRKMNGPSLFGAPNDKYVVLEGNRILVINTQGEVWAHDLSESNPTPGTFGGLKFDTVSTGRKLNGPGLFGAPNDKYVAYVPGHLLVINNLGEVWARAITSSEVGPGVKLNGSGLFGGANDKYVVTYDTPYNTIPR